MNYSEKEEKDLKLVAVNSSEEIVLCSDTAMALPSVLLPVYKGYTRFAIWPAPNLVSQH